MGSWIRHDPCFLIIYGFTSFLVLFSILYYGGGGHDPFFTGLFQCQAVYNANKFAKFVRRKDRLQNWLDYYRLKLERHPDRRPTVKVPSLTLDLWRGPLFSGSSSEDGISFTLSLTCLIVLCIRKDFSVFVEEKWML